MQKMFAAVKSLTVLKPIIFHGIMLCFPTRNPVFSQTVYDLKIVAAIALVVDVDLSVYRSSGVIIEYNVSRWI